MDKGKYQPWSHEEFMADRKVRRMSPTALKTYMLLLHEAWFCSTRPHLPDDEEELELMAYCADHEEWLTVKDQVLQMFNKETVDGRKVLVNKRLGRDWEKLVEIRKANSENGKAGAYKRWYGPPIAPDGERHDSDSKEVSKEVKESQEEEDMKIERQIDLTCENYFGHRANLRGRNLEELKKVVYVHKGSAVERAFGEWAKENNDNPDIKDPLAVFLSIADDLLSDGTPVRAAAKSPEAVNLSRELSYLSGGDVAFSNKHRAVLSELLQEYSAEEILGAWRNWLPNQDDDPKFLAGKFVQAADNLCYAARRREKERQKTEADREATSKRLQEEAEAECRLAREREKAEEALFDPLSA